MQSPKPRPGSLEVPQKKSPTATPRTARKLKIAETDPVSSPNPKIRTPKAQSPKVVAGRGSPRTPVNEKKRTGRTPETASQISQLQEELKKAKEQVSASEASKKEAQDEADETKQQLMEINASEDSRIDELRKLSQERDKTWQSELEAMQRQHAMDSTALASAMSEVQKLKAQLSESESLENLRMELNETLSLVEELRGEVYDAKEGEARAHEIVSATEKQLEIANLTLEMLRSDGMKVSEACNALTTELEQSKSEVKSLEQLVRQLEEEEEEDKDSSSVEELKEEINAARHEISQLKSAVEATERRYQEEYVQSTLQIRSAYEREAELGEELKRTKGEREALHERLMDKEAKLRILVDENELLNLKIKETEEVNLEREVRGELKKLESDVVELRGNLMDKEMELQSVMSQNESLRSEMDKVQSEKNKSMDEALERLERLKEEADKSGKRAENATEQLEAAQVSNTEIEAELRRLKVQCDQWRKAAEAAATMISDGNKNGNGKYVERTGSLESPLRRNVNMSPYMDETDDDLSSLKKKNGSMLKKFGVLLKKSQK
ncbi:Interactor of constitutive active ROPs 2 [Hirschfeldia incana]|nr:Interactor of constitutive active ROPs 2 [Hirschfeldia incana]